MRGDVEVGAIPQHVGAAVGARIEQDARVLPGLRRQVEPEDVEIGADRVEEAGPPEAVVPPELALRLGAARRAARAGEGPVLVADVAQRGRSRRRDQSSHQKKAAHQGGQARGVEAAGAEHGRWNPPWVSARYCRRSTRAASSPMFTLLRAPVGSPPRRARRRRPRRSCSSARRRSPSRPRCRRRRR